MRIIIFSVLILVMAIASDSSAQSGSRGGIGGGGGSSIGGGGGSFGGGGGSFGGSSFGSGRLSRTQRLIQAQQEQQYFQQQAQLAAAAQAENAKQQRKQTLAQLAQKQNQSTNSRLYRLAFAEAKKDFQNLRSKRVSPQQLGTLQQPFRLTRKDIDRDNKTAHWPEGFENEQFEELVQKVDMSIMESAIKDAESAALFLQDLNTLSTALNTIAASGEIDIRSYAKARRFITGLANEILVTDLVM